MVIINFNDKDYECNKAVKYKDTIRLYDENGNAFTTFSKVDFNAFLLKQGEWSLSEEDERALYDIDLDFKVSCLEMGVNVNDL